MPRDHVSIQQHALRRERDKSKESRHERDRSLEMKESLLSQALEGGPTLTIPSQVNKNLSRYDSFGCDLLNISFVEHSIRIYNHFKPKAPVKTQTAVTPSLPMQAMFKWKG